MMRTTTTIKDLYNHYKTLTSAGAFLGTLTTMNHFEFMSDYYINHSQIDALMCLSKYSDLAFSCDDTPIATLYNTFRTFVDATLITNKYKYQKLFDTLSLEYNPIDNYDMTESGTDTKGARTDTNGAYTDVITNDAYNDKTKTNAYTDITANASAQDKVTNGAQSRTMNDGAQIVNTVVTNDVTGYNLTPSDTHPNATALDNSTTTNTNNGAKLSSENITAYDVTNDYGARTTTFDGDERETNVTVGQRKTHEARAERTNTEGEQINTFSHRRRGNLGVQTTQSMIEQERQVAMFNLYELIFDDIMKATCIPIYA